MITELNQRSRDIFRQIVEAYVETGEPVGSRTLSRRLGIALSPATIRNVMADLEELGLLKAPHTSAGRVPTDVGLRLFVNGLLEVGDLSDDERESIDAQCAASGRSLPEALEEATTMLSGLSSCAGLVMAPKTDRPLKHIEFVNLQPGRALVVLVTEDGLVENRVVEVPMGIPSSVLQMASNYLNARVVGRTLAEARTRLQAEAEEQRTQLDELTRRVVDTGMATWAGSRNSGVLIVRGQAKLLDDVSALSDLERIRSLFEALETRDAMMRLLEATGQAEGVQIFIGAENNLFSHAGCSLIVSPYTNGKDQIVGAIGVIGPTRINYARIIPMVDYTAKVISRMIG
ncbi:MULTISPECIES: heat-inducible transcriptional repressor HrcA [Nitrospirillum]|uniref:Heat-inducible transcription repressor HrcA n=1 Tax=Nitrospirillum amazonense TaxID=28077 RepID=A0A560FA87_9PROT|nr:heat-inducible transcriptional repressor HrcA [Nitrospirillum amazonense]TWB18532.1 heat-inducible transcription repressor HrcA [Nitrospirillum amazonense]TWB75421.1 heat-inducible transcription repressor HrcA [Nitrospirillum amazonense]